DRARLAPGHLAADGQHPAPALRRGGAAAPPDALGDQSAAQRVRTGGAHLPDHQRPPDRRCGRRRHRDTPARQVTMATILVVEDEYALAGLLRDMLQEEGYAVVLASNGSQALEQLAETRPDLILSDVMMPGMDGRALTRALRTDPH